MSFCFHIIYTAGTVKPLQLLLHSLLQWSDCTFCLVANGCAATEQRALQQLCAGNPRLSYKVLPTQQVMLHGDALNILQEQNQTDYFCFMDSDIYAVAEFLPVFLPLVTRYSGLFSGMPLRYPQTGLMLPQATTFMAGPYTHTSAQLCLGTTFFAIYNNRVITEVRRATGIGFCKYHWAEIPAPYQKRLQAMGLQYQIYDTAKLLNLVLQWEDHALHHQPAPMLRHIEAVSRFAVVQQRAWWRQLRVLGGRWRRKLLGQKTQPSYATALPYLSQVLLALANGQPIPPQPTLTGTEPDTWVTQTKAELLALHAEFSKQSLS